MKIPGVYIKELNAFPNALVAVPTSVPAFIGYTETALRDDGKDLRNLPVRIGSLDEYRAYFGGPPAAKVRLTADGQRVDGIDLNSQFYLYNSLRLYFDNGGKTCYIVSAGLYADAVAKGKRGQDLSDAPLKALAKELESTIIVVPDAMLLGDAGDARAVTEQVLAHCGAMQSRIVICDIYRGDQRRSNDDQDIISGAGGFRSLTSDFLSYGAAYYPWLHTSLIGDDQVDYRCLTPESLAALIPFLKDAAARSETDTAKRAELQAAIDQLGAEEPAAGLHNMLMAALPAYKSLMQDVGAALNVLPPSGGIAGVYVRIDNVQGVHRAPANTGINSALAPVVSISAEEQEDLNLPLNGMAVNAIRVLAGRGMLIWGARTLDGNSQDWRYVNVRRTVIMLEQSIKAAMQAYMFEPNTSLTWGNVRSMIERFLTEQWKAGVLIGGKPEDAYYVSVGPGASTTGGEAARSYMLVSIKVSLVRPAEFIEITFQQLTQS